VVLFHVTANAEWSSLPLSGLFVSMLERLAVVLARAPATAAELEGTTWVPESALDAYGELRRSTPSPGVPGRALARGQPGPDLPPGLYAGEDRRIAVNAVAADATLDPAAWPESVRVEGLDLAREMPAQGACSSRWRWALLVLDVLASLLLSGGCAGPRAAPRRALLGALLLGRPTRARRRRRPAPEATEAPAEPEEFALAATGRWCWPMS
jgi:hypothetical protein